LTDYSKYYKSVDSLKIVAILRNAEKYDSASIEAARAELASRNLSDEELGQIQLALDNAEQLRNNQSLHQEEIKKKLKTQVSSGVKKTWGIIDIDQPNSIDMQIKILASFFILNGLWMFCTQFYLFKYLFSEADSSRIVMNEYLTILLVVLPIVVGLLFWKKYAIGYYLCFALLALVLISNILLSVLYFLELGFDAFPDVSSLSFMFLQLSIIVFGLMFLLKKQVKEIFLPSEPIK